MWAYAYNRRAVSLPASTNCSERPKRSKRWEGPNHERRRRFFVLHSPPVACVRVPPKETAMTRRREFWFANQHLTRRCSKRREEGGTDWQLKSLTTDDDFERRNV